MGTSKSLRFESTTWEKKLWKHLRAGRFNGFKFKRQVVIESFIVDFCCNALKLIIELDGFHHKYLISDKVRDKLLKDLGYEVLRFWDSEVDNNISLVLEKIEKVIKKRVFDLSLTLPTLSALRASPPKGGEKY